MGEEVPERQIEELLDGAGESAAAETDPALVTDLARQRRMHLLLTAYLSDDEGDRVYSLIRSSCSGSRRERIAAAIGKQVGRPMQRERPRAQPALRFTWLAAAAVLMAALGLWLWLPIGGGEKGTIAAIQLSKTSLGLVVQRAGKSVATVAGMELLPGDGLTASTDGAEIVYADGSHVRLAAGTRLDVQRDAGGKRLRIGAGTVMATVGHQPVGAPLVVTGTHGQAEVVGTVFTLAEGELGTRLQVDEGVVRMSGSGAAVMIHAGAQALAARDRAPEPYTPFSISGLVARVTDECDDLAAWNDKLGGLMERTITHDDPASGLSCIRLDFRLAPDRPIWSSRGRSLPLLTTDRAIRFRLRVERADPGAEFFLHVRESDGDVRVLAQWPVAAGGGWRTVVVPLPPPERPPHANEAPEGRWQVERVKVVLFGAEYAGLTVCVDQLEVLTGR